MNFTLDGSGSAQQQAWVNEAIPKCSYRLHLITATVTVVWGAFPGNLDSTHPYMCTVLNSPGNLTITIAPWADDPTDPRVQGLPDPAKNVHDFYVESFVHEIGHCVAYTTFDTTDSDPRVAQMCGLFWRSALGSSQAAPAPQGQPALGKPPVSGTRYGTLSDWDAAKLPWPDEIREAVAEVFKCEYYTGRLIYQNRSNWELGSANWKTFLTLIDPGAPKKNISWSTDGGGGTQDVTGGGLIPVPANTGVLNSFVVTGSFGLNGILGHVQDPPNWPQDSPTDFSFDLEIAALEISFVRADGSELIIDVNTGIADSQSYSLFDHGANDLFESSGSYIFTYNRVPDPEHRDLITGFAGTLTATVSDVYMGIGGGIGSLEGSYGVTLTFSQTIMATGDTVTVTIKTGYDAISERPYQSVTLESDISGIIRTFDVYENQDPITTWENWRGNISFGIQLPFAPPGNGLYPFNPPVGSINVGPALRGAVPQSQGIAGRLPTVGADIVPAQASDDKLLTQSPLAAGVAQDSFTLRGGRHS